MTDTAAVVAAANAKLAAASKLYTDAMAAVAANQKSAAALTPMVAPATAAVAPAKAALDAATVAVTPVKAALDAATANVAKAKAAVDAMKVSAAPPAPPMTPTPAPRSAEEVRHHRRKTAQEAQNRNESLDLFLCHLSLFAGILVFENPHPLRAVTGATMLAFRCCFLFVVLIFTPPTASAADKVDFGRDIRPILSNACFKCHGPAVQKAKLRLDDRDVARDKGSHRPASQPIASYSSGSCCRIRMNTACPRWASARGSHLIRSRN